MMISNRVPVITCTPWRNTAPIITSHRASFLVTLLSCITFVCEPITATATTTTTTITTITTPSTPTSSSSSSPSSNYFLFIDAGSTGTRIFVHTYYFIDGEDIPIIETADKIKVKPGLSAYATNPLDAGESILPLLIFAQKHVPKERWSETPLYLQATAGLRTLEPDVAERILDACRDVMEKTPFQFQRSNVRLITGNAEGLAGWIATNYLAGTFNTHSNGTSVGVIEMGGASLQLTFAPTDAEFHNAPTEYVHVITMGKHTYRVYTHSYLGYGLETAQEAYRLYHEKHSDEPHDLAATVHACYPQHLKYDTVGNYNRCYHAMSVLFASEETDVAITDILTSTSTSTSSTSTCPHASCSFRGIYQPHITIMDHFIAIENFFYTTEFFAVQDHPRFVHALADAGAAYCQLSWHDIPHRWPHEPLDDLHKYCFSAAYIRQVLERGLRFDENTIENVKIKRNIGGINIEWSLGMVLLEITSLAKASKLSDEPIGRLPAEPCLGFAEQVITPHTNTDTDPLSSMISNDITPTVLIMWSILMLILLTILVTVACQTPTSRITIEKQQ